MVAHHTVPAPASPRSISRPVMRIYMPLFSLPNTFSASQGHREKKNRKYKGHNKIMLVFCHNGFSN